MYSKGTIRHKFTQIRTGETEPLQKGTKWIDNATPRLRNNNENLHKFKR